MLPKQLANFILKTDLAVMFFLILNVPLDLFQIRLANGEIRVSALPFESRELVTLLFQPTIRNSLEFFYPFRLRDLASEATQNVNVIFHAANLNRGTVKPLRNAAEIGVQRMPGLFITQEWLARLR